MNEKFGPNVDEKSIFRFLNKEMSTSVLSPNKMDKNGFEIASDGDDVNANPDNV